MKKSIAGLAIIAMLSGCDTSELDKLEEKVEGIGAQVDQIKKNQEAFTGLLDARAQEITIKSISSNNEGTTLTLSNDETIYVPCIDSPKFKGDKVTIGDNGNWFINGTDTGVSSKGADGSNGVAPVIGDNGNWLINGADSGIKAEVPVVTKIEQAEGEMIFTFSSGSEIKVPMAAVEKTVIKNGLYVAKASFFDHIYSTENDFQKEEILVKDGTPILRRWQGAPRGETVVHKCDKFEVNRADPLIIFNGYPENIIKGKFIDPYYKYSYEEYSGDTCSFFKAIVMIGEDGLLIGYDYYGDKTEFTAKISDDLKTVYHLPKNGTYRTESGHEVVIDIDHNKNIQVRLANGKVYKYIGEKITGNTWTDSFTTFEFKNSKSESLRYFKIVLDKFTGVLRIDGDDLTIKE